MPDVGKCSCCQISLPRNVLGKNGDRGVVEGEREGGERLRLWSGGKLELGYPSIESNSVRVGMLEKRQDTGGLRVTYIREEG